MEPERREGKLPGRGSADGREHRIGKLIDQYLGDRLCTVHFLRKMAEVKPEKRDYVKVVNFCRWVYGLPNIHYKDVANAWVGHASDMCSASPQKKAGEA